MTSLLGTHPASLGFHLPAVQVGWQHLRECPSGAGRTSADLVEA